jgi:Uma2 family endonuclease
MATTNGSSAREPGSVFTLENWRSWPAEERWELIGGVAYSMSPAPTVNHQIIAGKIYHELCNFLENNPCLPLIAPVDLFLPDGAPDSSDTVVEPDIMVVCDGAKIGDDGVHGAPDLVVEVLSDSTAYKDLTVKRALYERAKVREYWIVNPGTGSIVIYVLGEDGRYGAGVEIIEGFRAESTSLGGFSIILTSR